MADRQLLLLKTETTYGTSAAPAAADVVMAENVRYTPKGERKNYDISQPSVGPVRGFVYGEFGELSFDVALTASGVAGTAPKWGTAAKSCGWSETVAAGASVTYGLPINPRSAASCSMGWRDDRYSHLMLGSRGRVGLRFAEGDRPMLSFMFRGLHSIPTDGANLAAADATWTGWTTGQAVAQGRTTFSYGGVPLPLRELSVEQSDNVVFSDRPQQESVELIGARTFTGKGKWSSPLQSVLNLESTYLNNALSVISLVHGTDPGSIVTFSARAENGQPSYSRDKGFHVTDVDLEFKPSTIGGTDELLLVLS